MKQGQTLLWTCVAGAHLQCVKIHYAIDYTQCKHSRGVADVMMSQFNTSKTLANVRTRGGAQRQHVNNHNSKFEYKEIKTAGVNKTRNPHEMCAKSSICEHSLCNVYKNGSENFWSYRLHKLDGQPDEQTAG